LSYVSWWGGGSHQSAQSAAEQQRAAEAAVEAVTLAEAEKDSALLTEAERDAENLDTEQDEDLGYLDENREGL